MKRVLVSAFVVFLVVGTVWQANAAPLFPTISFGVTEATEPQEVELSLQVLFLLTILSLAPSILIMMTSFTRVVIVLSFVRNALATQQIPPNQVLIGLALFMTFLSWRQPGRQLMSRLSNRIWPVSWMRKPL